jgi:predicted oxidoreductase
MEQDRLAETTKRWNQYVAKGADEFHRLLGTIMPIEIAPFYAIEAWPTISNTQGGPVHNAKQQINDAVGEPIPRLYAAGELGSFFAHLYELAGNLGECISSGRVAGQHAANEEPQD